MRATFSRYVCDGSIKADAQGSTAVPAPNGRKAGTSNIALTRRTAARRARNLPAFQPTSTDYTSTTTASSLCKTRYDRATQSPVSKAKRSTKGSPNRTHTGRRPVVPPLLSMDETAKSLGVSISRVRLLIQEGAITPVMRLGVKQWQVFLKADVDELKRRREVKAALRRQIHET